MGAYLMGLDNGGSLIKCAIFDTGGNEAAAVSIRVDMDSPAPGFTERDPDAIWRANRDAIRQAVAMANIKAEEILGVATCGYGNGINFLDKHGDAVYPSIVSTDTRANDYVNRFAADGTLAKVNAITRQDIWAAQPVALLPWFRDHLPDVPERATHVQFIKDYVRYKLTGELCGELTDASGTNLFNLETRRYDEELFELAGISQYYRLFPQRIVGSTELAGRVTREAAIETGLKEGTPVAGGLFDIDACAVSSGLLDDSLLCLVSGTWTINEYITKDFDQGLGKYSTTLSYMPDHYLIAESSPTSASNFDWYLDAVYGAALPGADRKEQYRLCNEQVDAIHPGDSDIIFVPYLFASNSYPSDRGAFFNMSHYYNGKHMLRAVFEGVVFSTCLHVERLGRNREPFTRARLSGGVARSEVWAQMLADALQLQVEVVKGSELGALGAAMCAGISGGEFADFREASSRMVHLDRVYHPDPERSGIYAEKFQRFKRAVAALDMFHKPTA